MQNRTLSCRPPHRLLAGLALAFSLLGVRADPPNVLILYYDDLGYSNVGAYAPDQPSYTPNLDALAASGMRFTAGHSADAVCTPSRYAMLTGRYCWRTRLKQRVIGGYSRPLIAEDRLTIGKMFQELGYETAMVGKWHIGMQFYDPAGNPVDKGNDADVLGGDPRTTDDDEIDFSKPLSHTPTTYGFDYFFGSSASLDMPPYTWLENETVLFKGGLVVDGEVDFSQARPATNADFEEGEPIGAVNNVRDGVYDPNFVVSDYLQVQAAKVVELLRARAQDDKPFFIYVPFPSPHLPWSVSEQFRGSTPFAYGDYLAQSDHYAGVILDALADPDGNPETDDSLADETIVFMSSDNGVEKGAMRQGLNFGHDGNGPFRGLKLDNWEGGTRVPFVIRWPGKTAPGSVTDHFCWQGDFFATLAEHLHYDLTPDQAPDAESFLPVLSGQPMPEKRRPATIQHAYNGQLAIVDKDGIWKLLDGTGGNGGTSWDSANNELTAAESAGEIFGTPRQLFNLAEDIGEDNNLLPSEDPAILAKEAELYQLLNEIRGNTSYGTDGDSKVPPIDSDGDGLPNYFENETPGLDRDEPADGAEDFDADGLDNAREFESGANLFEPDSDGDRLQDALEVLTYFSNPADPHSDGDGLSDGDEVLIWLTDPTREDSDGDGVDDQEELAGFSNPTDARSTVPRGEPVTIALAPTVIQLVGSQGTVDDPAVQGAWEGSGELYVRERETGGSNQQARTALFLKFDLSPIPGLISEARLRLFQIHRLNDLHSGNLTLAGVTEAWAATPGQYPTLLMTPVAAPFVFGNNSDFGTSPTAAGFYSGTPGTPGDESGFDPEGKLTSLAKGWHEDPAHNHGLRLAFEAPAFVGAGFAPNDLPQTPEDESLRLLVTYTPTLSLDSDGDSLNDDFERTAFGDLTQTGEDDFDGDGMSNLIEWALGGDPSRAGHFPLLEVVSTGGQSGHLHFQRPVDSALGYEVKLSSDLVQWDPFTRYYQSPRSSPGGASDSSLLAAELVPHRPLPPALFFRLSLASPYSR
ncbi:sulfatase-like hydrolase/transferase [Roseibacillus ishigakijimensis]|uniref:Sulfatase-like hydrolase/transferase n=1 Tax=Roseibacillus ishigakijimensis TaxID=454146 RepID=A0A934RP39_9BACT|nr:sulfatase-like hydrolase/transferase [Roseibacillus ishigakijimensis]MBK1835387.1 sulfatase-like hydrolase/transferase [Roseibacillus ishigakijimensis]